MEILTTRNGQQDQHLFYLVYAMAHDRLRVHLECCKNILVRVKNTWGLFLFYVCITSYFISYCFQIMLY